MNFQLDDQYQCGPWLHPKSLISNESNVSSGEIRYILIKSHQINDYYKASKDSVSPNLVLWLPITKQEQIDKPSKKGKKAEKKLTSCY